MTAQNFHATALVLGTRGVLIAGVSGSGKTTLALALIEAWRSRGEFARLVADDQVLLSMQSGRLIAEAPAPIAGLVEVVGLGPRPVDHLEGAVIDGLARLVPSDAAPRFQEGTQETLHGCTLPGIVLAERNVERALPAVAAWLEGLN